MLALMYNVPCAWHLLRLPWVIDYVINEVSINTYLYECLKLIKCIIVVSSTIQGKSRIGSAFTFFSCADYEFLQYLPAAQIFKQYSRRGRRISCGIPESS